MFVSFSYIYTIKTKQNLYNTFVGESFSVRPPLSHSLSPLSFVCVPSWKCPVLLGGWLCHMWNIRHLVIGFVIKCSCLVDHKGRNILPN